MVEFEINVTAISKMWFENKNDASKREAIESVVDRNHCTDKHLHSVDFKENAIAPRVPEGPRQTKLLNDDNSTENDVKAQQEELSQKSGDVGRVPDTITITSDTEPNEERSLAIPDGLAMDPLAPNSMIVSTDFMERIENGLTLLKEHGKKVQKYVWKNTKFDTPKKTLSSVVTVVLVEARDLPSCSPGGSNGVYCKCRLGTEMHKSKSVPKTEQPAWRERFNMHLYEDNRLELSVWHKGKQKNFMGRCTIDLSTLERDRTHDLWYEMECGFGSLHLLLTLSGSPLAAPCDGIPTTYTNGTHLKPLSIDKYTWYNVNAGGHAVGEVRVTVHGARGLPLSTMCRPLVVCVLELDNARVQTHAARAAPDPLWNQTYMFEILDITSTLEASVHDQSIVSPIMGETLGKVSIPLLRINNGEKRWYALKDKSKKASARGNCPRILLEMNVVWNPIKASLRVLTPKEIKYIQKQTKFDIPLIYSNLKFITEAFHFVYDVNESFKELFEWDSVESSALALAAWLTVCYCFRLWMAPLALVTPFLYNWVTRRMSCNSNSLIPAEYIDQELEESRSETEKDDKSLKNRLNLLQDMTFTIKNGIDFVVSLAERIKNLTDFTVPYLSVLAMIILTTSSVALYLIPVNYIFMALGVYKFTRKLLHPNRVRNNDILDFFSRVPDNEVLKEWRELKVPEPNLTRMGSRRRPPI